MFDTSFINSQNSHARNGDAKNEKVMSFELGYGFRTGFFTANVNAYYTRWKDKHFTTQVHTTMRMRKV